jgi:hypothetical protein
MFIPEQFVFKEEQLNEEFTIKYRPLILFLGTTTWPSGICKVVTYKVMQIICSLPFNAVP